MKFLNVKQFPNKLISFMGVWVVCFAAQAESEAVPDRKLSHSTFQIKEENDGLAGLDRHYTQGLKMGYLFSESVQDDLDHSVLDRFSLNHFHDDEDVRGLVLGHHIYTPDDLDTIALLRKDRPYAGLLYLGGVYQKIGRDRAGHAIRDHYQISVGVVGPISFAEDAQKWAHRVSNSSEPAGWHNQLENEPAIALQFERTYRFSMESESGFWRGDLLPQGGISLGNIETSARAGMVLRFGLNMPEDFGTGLIRSISMNSGEERKSGWGLYFQGRAGARVVAYDVFLDGNLFSDSHSVDKKYFVPDLGLGVVLVTEYFELGYQHVFAGPEFMNQNSWDQYGSIGLSVHF